MKSLVYLSGAPRVSTRPEAIGGGPRTHILGAIRGFEKLGWTVHKYIVGDMVPLSWITEPENKIFDSLLKRCSADILRAFLGLTHGIRSSLIFGKIDIDWAYERYGSYQALGWWHQRRGVPWVLETNDLYYINAVKDRKTVATAIILREFERWAYYKCDVIVCVSDALAKLIHETFAIPQSKIVVIPNGVDEDQINPQKATAKRFFDVFTIGFVGQLYGWQKLDLLIETLSDLSKENLHCSLVVVGDGPKRKEWEELVSTFNLKRHVCFVGQVPPNEVINYIAGFDVGYAGAAPLFAGDMYLSPLKLYEYAAMGKPILASDYPDARSLLKDGVPVYLFEPGNKESLKHAIKRAHAEHSLWKSLGNRIRGAVVKHHSWQARIGEAIPQIEAVIEEKYGTAYPARRTNKSINH